MTTKHDPTRTLTKQNKAAAEIRRRLKVVFADVQKYVASITSRAVAVNRAYEFQIDPWQMERIVPDIEQIIAGQFVDEGWLFGQYVGPAYTQGALTAAESLAHQAAHVIPDIGRHTPPHMTAAFQARYELIRARMFELMEGFAGETARDLGGILSRAILDGLNPADIAPAIAARFDVAEYRADRIARTEITTALRRGRLDESEASADRVGLQVKFMHISAFSTTTRVSHAARHGKLYSADEVREWYSVDANAINCRCAQVETFLGADGQPLAPGLLKRAEQIKEKYQHLME